jgi:hypothetical protein
VKYKKSRKKDQAVFGLVRMTKSIISPPGVTLGSLNEGIERAYVIGRSQSAIDRNGETGLFYQTESISKNV